MAIVVPFPIGASASDTTGASPRLDAVEDHLAARQVLADVEAAIAMVCTGRASRIQLVNVIVTPASVVAARTLALAGGARLEVRPATAGPSSSPEPDAHDHAHRTATIVVEPAR